MAYTFDGPNKLIYLSSGTTSLDLIDLYARWKDWVRTGNAGFLWAFTTVGGDIPAIPLYLFLTNGWRVVPQAANHVLVVSNGFLEVDGGGDPFIDPAGSFKIRINRETPGIGIGYTTSGGDPATIAAAVWANATGAAVASRLAEAWGRLGLDPSKPLITGANEITFGDIAMALTTVGTDVTVTRQ
jgi:hypothetical protein